LPPEQVTLAEVREASSRRGGHEQITAWLRAGQLQDVLQGRDPGAPSPGLEPEPDPEPEPRGSADQGARVGPNLGQLSEDDLKTLHAQGRYAEIDKAHREGRCDRLLGRIR
jgi:hypothetical protein